MGTKRNVDMSSTTDTVKIVKTKAKKLLKDDIAPETVAAETATEVSEAEVKTSTAKAKKFVRSHRYVAKRSLVDRTKEYDPASAIELVKKTSYSKFPGTVVADLICREAGDVGSVTLPHSTGKVAKVAIASDELIAQLEKGVIDFEILLSAPAFIPKLAKHAKRLGPKGLMPNPKNGTITAQPEKRKKELEAGAMQVRTDRKFPIAHVVIGKTSMSEKDLLENLTTLTSAFKNKLLKLSLSATMSPGVKVKVEKV